MTIKIPDKIFHQLTWNEICVYIYIQKMKGVVTHPAIMKEFSISKSTSIRIVKNLYNYGLVFSAHDTSCDTSRDTSRSGSITLSSNMLSNIHNNPRDTSLDTSLDTSKPFRKIKTIEERKKDFVNALSQYLEQYGKDMLNDFYCYWTETRGDNGKTMRFEMQPTFQIGGRLATWHKNMAHFGSYREQTKSASGIQTEKEKLEEWISQFV